MKSTREQPASQEDLNLAATLALPMQAGVRRLWLQGKPVYEDVGGRTYAWWPDGRLEPRGHGGPELFSDPQPLLIN